MGSPEQQDLIRLRAELGGLLIQRGRAVGAARLQLLNAMQVRAEIAELRGVAATASHADVATEGGGYRFFFGWKVVAVSFVIAVYAWGLGFYGPSIFVNELVRTRGWPVSAVSGAVTFHFLFGALLVMGLAEAHERFGLVTVTRMGVLAFGIGIAGFAWAGEVWHLYVAAMFTAFGWAATSGPAINAFISRWFERRRGMALSHAFNGASVGGVAMLPLWSALIADYGFGVASIVVAVGGLMLLWPLTGRVSQAAPGRSRVAAGRRPTTDVVPGAGNAGRRRPPAYASRAPGRSALHLTLVRLRDRHLRADGPHHAPDRAAYF